MATIHQKKSAKQIRLLDAAYDLFTSKGVNSTAIDEIVKKASVAKGTFYLYFQDKYDILDKIVLYKSADVIARALEHLALAQEGAPLPFEEQVLCFTSFLVDYLQENKEMALLVRKNLAACLYFKGDENATPFFEAVEPFIQEFMNRGNTRNEAVQTLYILIEMVGSVCCDALLDKLPFTLEELKPTLYRFVRKILINETQEERGVPID